MERRSSVFGTLLIIAGLFLLARNLGWIDIALWQLWPLLLVGGGGYDLVKGFKDRSNHHALTTGTVLVVYGLLFLACNYRGWDLLGIYWPVFLLGPGLGALLAYFWSTHRRQDLNTGLILSGLAVLFWFNEWRFLLPVALIVAGILMLLHHGRVREAHREPEGRM